MPAGTRSFLLLIRPGPGPGSRDESTPPAARLPRISPKVVELSYRGCLVIRASIPVLSIMGKCNQDLIRTKARITQLLPLPG
jgi:hypothetical protein